MGWDGIWWALYYIWMDGWMDGDRKIWIWGWGNGWGIGMEDKGEKGAVGAAGLAGGVVMVMGMCGFMDLWIYKPVKRRD